jgi:hypothetical protein
VIVLRPKDFQKHTAQFLIGCSVPQAATREAVSSVYSCWPVPPHLQQCHWTTVLTQHAQELSRRQLALPDAHSSRVLNIFSKFEAPEYIHVFTRGHCPGLLSTASSTQRASAASSSPPPRSIGRGGTGMVWQLPRCSLEFELSADSRVVSLDHRGYCLSSQQLLVSKSAQGVTYTLPELHQYLVLQAQPASTSKYVGADQSNQLVLVPAGTVSVQQHAPGSAHLGSSIHVQLEPHCFAAVKVRVAGQMVTRHMQCMSKSARPCLSHTICQWWCRPGHPTCLATTDALGGCCMSLSPVIIVKSFHCALF